MDYYINQRIMELQQQEAAQKNWYRELVKTALYCCEEATSSLIGRIKLAFQNRFANVCCSSVE